MNKPKEVHTTDYNGPDRRGQNPARRTGDVVANNVKLTAVALGIAMSIFAMGGGWVAARMAIESKVSQQEFDAKNADQDRQRAIIENRQDRLEDLILKRVIPQLDKMDSRLSAIYCGGKPPGCQ